MDFIATDIKEVKKTRKCSASVYPEHSLRYLLRDSVLKMNVPGKRNQNQKMNKPADIASSSKGEFQVMFTRLNRRSN